MARVCVVNDIPKDGILQILHGVKNGVKEWPSQKPSTDIPSVDQDAEGDMVDVDGEGEIVGSGDEGEVVVQGARSGVGMMGAYTCRCRTTMCFKANRGVSQRQSTLRYVYSSITILEST